MSIVLYNRKALSPYSQATAENVNAETTKIQGAINALQSQLDSLVAGTPIASYTWVAWADSLDGTANFNNAAAGNRAYVGFAFGQVSPIRSNFPEDYTWSRLRGIDGSDGVGGLDGVDGEDGKWKEFVFKVAAEQPPTPTGNGIPAGWNDEPPLGDGPMWMSIAKQELDGALIGAWSEPVRINGEDGAVGDDGVAGAQSAIVFAYRRASSTPALPSAPCTYEFATKSLTGLNSGWTATIPAGSDPIYVTSATAAGTGTTDTIPSAEWASPVILAENGVSAAVVFLFQRTATATPPDVPSTTSTYTFATGGLVGFDNGWTQSLPASGGAFRWLITASALGINATDTIGTGEWSTATMIGQDGEDGVAGVSGYTHIAYADNDTGTANFTTGAPGQRGYQGISPNNVSPTESTNPANYQWGQYRGPATFGLVAHGVYAVIGPDYVFRNNGGYAWDSGAYSSEAYIGGAFASFVAGTAASGETMLGLNTDPTLDATYPGIDFAWYCNGNAGTPVCFVYESGVGYSIGAYAAGDVFTVQYDNRNVRYFQNGALKRTVAAPAGLRLYLDSALSGPNGRLSGIRFGPVGQAGADGAAGTNGTNGPPGNPGADGVAYLQDPTPGAPANPKQLWYKPSTRQFFYWSGAAWIQLTGNLALYDQITTSLISVNTIIASHFITDQGVDLAAMVPGTLGWRGTTTSTYSYPYPPASSSYDSGLIGVSATGPAHPSYEWTFTVTTLVQPGTVNARNVMEIYYSHNGGAWTYLASPIDEYTISSSTKTVTIVIPSIALTGNITFCFRRWGVGNGGWTGGTHKMVFQGVPWR